MMLPNPNTRRRVPMIPFLVFSIGLGICLYVGQQYYELPKYNDADIDASAELNVQLELRQRAPGLPAPTAEEANAMRAKDRAEIAGLIQADRTKLQQRFGVGLIALVFGLSQLVTNWMWRRMKPK
ncbi:MAG: hypothetical protein ACRETW_04030 [Stenotrophobium sp.]